MRDFLEEYKEPIFIGVALIAFLLLFFVATYYQTKDCEDKGGHIVTKSTSSVTVKGDVAMGSVSFCVSKEGRILD